jgi:hypothetical protein
VSEVWAGVSGGLQVRVWRSLRRARRKRTWRQHGAALSIPVAMATLNRIGLGPLESDLSGAELRRAGLRAFDQVLDRLGVEAAHTIFGHTHRAGPLPGDDRQEWLSQRGSTMLNTGSWVDSPDLIGDSPGGSPYRAGFAALVGDQDPPELVNLLDGAPPQEQASAPLADPQARPGVKQTAGHRTPGPSSSSSWPAVLLG